MLKPKAKIIIAVCLVLMISTAYWLTQNSHTKRIDAQILDTLNYGKKDYDLMRVHYKSDTAFQTMLHEKIQMGDSAAFQLKKLINLPYELRYHSGVEETDIKAMIYAYHTSKSVLDKFADIEKQLEEMKKANAPKNAEDSAIQRHLDSLRILAIEGKLK